MLAKFVTAIVLVVLLLNYGNAQEFKAGQSVVVVTDDVLEGEDGLKSKVWPGLPLTVQRVENISAADGSQQTRLLVSHSESGWLSSESIRLPEEAIAFFEEKIIAGEDVSKWQFSLAMSLAAGGKHDEAILIFNQLIEKDATNEGYLNERAGSNLALRKFDLAEEDFDVLIAKNPSPVFYNNRALCRRAQKNIPGARSDLEEALRTAPQFAAAYTQLAYLEIDAGNIDAALAVHQRMIEANPNSDTGYRLRADLLLKTGRREEALADLEKIIALVPDEFQIQLNRAILLRELGKPAESISELNKIIEQFPNQQAGFINRGIAYEQMEKWPDAYDDLNQALTFKSEHDAFLHYHRGCVLIGLQRFEEAVVDLSEAIGKQPLAIAYARRGEANQSMGQAEAAIKDFNQALAGDPNNHFSRYRRATIYQGQGKNDLALEDYNVLIKAGVQSAPVFYNRGHILSRKKNWAGAIESIQQALALSPAEPGFLNDLAWLLATVPEQKLRDPKRAVELATQACELSNWQSGLIIDTLATAYAANGDFSKAIELEKKAMTLPDAEKSQNVAKHLQSFESQTPIIID